jgi:NAD(P)-dependent dehydrogenase (short-subunit alcohol dehydrogenase family)
MRKQDIGGRCDQHREQKMPWYPVRIMRLWFGESRATAPEPFECGRLGQRRIRVNVVNPDAVIAESKIWESGWAEGRAKAYGVSIEELPAYYAKRTLLNEMILPEDIANACFAFVGGLLNKSTVMC